MNLPYEKILKKVISLQALHQHGLNEATALRNMMEGEIKKPIKRKVSDTAMRRNLRINQNANK